MSGCGTCFFFSVSKLTLLRVKDLRAIKNSQSRRNPNLNALGTTRLGLKTWLLWIYALALVISVAHRRHANALGYKWVLFYRLGSVRVTKRFELLSKLKMEINPTLELEDDPAIVKREKAPLVDALKASAEQNAAAFHFPGHNRGRAAPSSLSEIIGTEPFLHDLPELPELDNLFAPEGAIADAQERAACLFGADATWFLVGGSTCGIQAAVMATCSPGEILILPRNCHMSVVSAMVLSGALPKYIMPDYDPVWDITYGISSFQVKEALDELKGEGKQAAAVLITSPTYFGICSDLREIAEVCHVHGLPLIVDEAHGAHFKFHSGLPKSALEQGADLVVQSTHKVLFSFTQSAMLHVQGKMIDMERVRRCLQTLQSSSPNYLLLASLDAARAYISEHNSFPDSSNTLFERAIKLASEARHAIQHIHGISVFDSVNCAGVMAYDPLRITVGLWEIGLSGYEADDILRIEHGVIAELPSLHSLMFAVSPGTASEHINRLVQALQSLSVNYAKKSGFKRSFFSQVHESGPFATIRANLSPREAFFAKTERVEIKHALGQICGELICPYPPGIPVLIPGEVISDKALLYLKEVIRVGATISGASDSTLSSMIVCKVL
eukprot:Gb_10109 [translate_table: standard]